MPRPDPQKMRVYRMERELRGMSWHSAPLSYLRRRASATCKHYGLPQVTLSVRKLAWAAEYTPGEDKIVMDVEEMNAASVAHELAHHYVHYKHPKAQDHGPQFVKAYGLMLRAFRLSTVNGFRAQCREFGVKHA